MVSVSRERERDMNAGSNTESTTPCIPGSGKVIVITQKAKLRHLLSQDAHMAAPTAQPQKRQVPWISWVVKHVDGYLTIPWGQVTCSVQGWVPSRNPSFQNYFPGGRASHSTGKSYSERRVRPGGHFLILSIGSLLGFRSYLRLSTVMVSLTPTSLRLSAVPSAKVWS